MGSRYFYTITSTTPTWTYPLFFLGVIHVQLLSPLEITYWVSLIRKLISHWTSCQWRRRPSFSSTARTLQHQLKIIFEKILWHSQKHSAAYLLRCSKHAPTCGKRNARRAHIFQGYRRTRQSYSAKRSNIKSTCSQFQLTPHSKCRSEGYPRRVRDSFAYYPTSIGPDFLWNS